MSGMNGPAKTKLMVSTLLWLRYKQRRWKRTESEKWISEAFIEKEWLSRFPTGMRETVKSLADAEEKAKMN